MAIFSRRLALLMCAGVATIMKVIPVLLLFWSSIAQGSDFFQTNLISEKIQQTFITNGLRASRNQFPYQAAIYIGASGGTGFCGGSLITEEYVLTAAHCVYRMRNFTIILGAHQLTDKTEEGRQVFEVSSDDVVVHEDWNPSTIRNDLALLRLPRKAILNDFVQLVKLPRISDDNSLEQSGQFTTVSGWGRESDDSESVAEYLQYINQPLITNFKCNLYYLFRIRAGHICTSGAGKMSTCNGDSGGPLVAKDETDAVKQIGIVSFGILLGCEKGWPPVFTRVSYYLDFIETTTGLDLS